MIEKRIKNLDNVKYSHMEYSKIFLEIYFFFDLKNKLVNQNIKNEKKIQKK